MKHETLKEKVDLALKYAARGWRVVPSHWPVGEGTGVKCSCGKAHDHQKGIGKHPLVSNWVERATTDGEAIQAWFKVKPAANLSIVTGRDSGIFVLDIDAGSGGIETIHALTQKHGNLPLTPTFLTGSGGVHRLFKDPGWPVPTKASIASGIDIRGNGGQIIAPPSRNANGTYTIDPDVPLDTPVADAPAWLLDLIRGSSPRHERYESHPRFDMQEALNGVPEGQRDETMFKFACKMRDEDLPLEMALQWIRQAAENCTPPFPIDIAEEKVTRAYQQYAPRVRWDTVVESGPQRHELEMEHARQLVRTLPDRVKEDKSVPFEPETLGALALIEKDDPATWIRTREQLKNSGVLVAKLDQALAGHKRRNRQHLRLVRPGDTAPLPTAGQMLVDAPVAELMLPDGYCLRPDATIRVVPGEEGPVEHVVAYAPVLLAGRLRDEDEPSEYLRLTFRKGERWREQIVGRGIALDSKQLVGLASQGFPVSSDNVKELVRYLHRLEAINHDQVPSTRVSSHLGWQGSDGDAGFLWGRTHLAPPGWTDLPIAFHGLDGGDEQIADAYQASGTLTEWLKAVNSLQSYPKPLVALYTAFVPVLQARLRIPNFALDLHNRTSTGKTTSARVAASVWGNPDEREPDSAVGSWDATRVYAERAAGVLSGIPIILDDTKRAKKPAMVADLLYTLANGRGRGRGNRTSLARTRSWRTVLISTGESPATSFTQDGGTRMRCLEVSGMPFGKEDPATAQFVDQLNLQIRRHYGHAGPEVVRCLNAHPEMWSRLEARYRAGVEYYAVQNPRLATYMSAIHVAAELAHEVLKLPWCPCHTLWPVWQEMAAEGEDAAGEGRALRHVISWVHANRDKFEGQQHPNQMWASPGGLAGRWDKIDAWNFIALFPHILDQLLTDAGYEPTAIKAGWRERGWIDAEPKRLTKSMRVDGSQTHLVVIRRSAIDEVDT